MNNNFTRNSLENCYAAKGDFRPLHIEYINGVRYNIRGKGKSRDDPNDATFKNFYDEINALIYYSMLGYIFMNFLTVLIVFI